LSLQREAFRQALVELPDDERGVLELRYGLAVDNQPRTIDQVVRQLGMSRGQVRKLEEHGLAQLATRWEVQALR
jgi:RNA polymerase sigma factor (sigma-70 family)